MYSDLYKLYNEGKKVGSGIVEKLVGGIIMIGGLLGYRYMIDKSADPLFRDFGRSFTKLGSL